MRDSAHCVLLLLLITSGLANGQTASAGKLTLVFEGNKVFSEQDLLEVANNCFAQYSNSGSADDSDTIDYCLHKVKTFLWGKGYLSATLREPRREQTGSGLTLTVRVEEGALYRLGEVKIERATALSPTQILGMLDLKTGDTADAESLTEWIDVRVRRSYADLGYIQYSGELEPNFHLKAGAVEGIVDLTVTIDEGHAFTIRSIKFEGNGNVPEDVLRGEMLVQNGEVFNKELFVEGLKKISQTGQFEVIDVDKDIDYRGDNKGSLLDLTIHLKKKVPATQETQSLTTRFVKSSCQRESFLDVPA